MMTMAKIFMAVPSYRPDPEKLAALKRHASDLGAHLNVMIGCPLLELVRSRLEAEFMASDCTHLYWRDDDVTVAPADVHAMVSEGLPIVGAAYRDRHDPGAPRWNVRITDGDEKDAQLQVFRRPSGRRVAAVLGLGFGCLVVQRAVVERLWAAHPELSFVDDQSGRPAVMTFKTTIENERYLGEDLSWCARARRIGFPTLAALDVVTTHDGIRGCFGDAFRPATVAGMAAVATVVAGRGHPPAAAAGER
jgi:hypothetical protein